MTVPDIPVTGHPAAMGSAVEDREGAGEGLGVEINVEAMGDGAAVGSGVATGLCAEDEGEDDPHEATNVAIAATAARRRAAALRITGLPSTDTQRGGIT